MQPFSTIILANGQSSRMGQDKAQLIWQGQPLWKKQQQLARYLGCHDIWLSHHRLGEPDKILHAGPLGGLHTLIPKCCHSKVLVLAVDMPLLDEELLDTLLQASLKQSAYFQNCALPCVLHTNDALQRYIENNIIQGNRSIKGLLAYAEAQAIECSAPEKLINTNTPEQWQAVLAAKEAV